MKYIKLFEKKIDNPFVTDLDKIYVDMCDNIEPIVKRIFDVLDIKVSKFNSNTGFDIKFLDTDSMLYPEVEKGKIMFKFDFGDEDHPENVDSIKSEEELLHYVLMSIIDTYMFDDSIGRGVIPDDLIEKILIKEPSWITLFDKMLKDNDYDGVFTDLVSDKIKEKYDYIFKNELF